MLKKPRIAVCIDPSNETSADLMIGQFRKDMAEVVVVKDYPALASRIQANRPPDWLRSFDALIIMGNDQYDIDPSAYYRRYNKTDPRYGYIHPETKSENTDSLAQSRMIVERHLVCEALQRKVPLLGICGGMQRINIECGEEIKKGGGKGTLIQHLPDRTGDNTHDQERMGYDPHATTQSILVEAGTKLAGIIKSGAGIDAKSIDANTAPETTLSISTRHHQAIDTLAEGLICSAYSIDPDHDLGKPIHVIKAIEAAPSGIYKDQFIMGIQFHPELVRDHHLAETLANRMVQEAKTYAIDKSETRRHLPRTKIIPRNTRGNTAPIRPSNYLA